MWTHAIILVVGFFLNSASGAVHLDWVRRTSLPFDDWVLDIAYGQGRFVAVGEKGVVLVSRDGVDWQRRVLNAEVGPLNTVRFVNDRFIAIAPASTDPYGGFNRGSVWVSANGDAWTRLESTLGLTATQSLADILWTGTRYIAVGFEGSRTFFLTSDDGTVWRNSLGAPSFSPLRMVHNDNGIVVIGRDNALSVAAALVSTDTVKWELVPIKLPGGERLGPLDVCASNRLFVAVGGGQTGDNGYMLSSPDGKTWTDRTPARIPSRLQRIAYARGQFVTVAASVGLGTALAFTSPDGIAWTPRGTGLERVASLPTLTALTSYSEGFLCSGNAGHLLRSQDGVRWTQLDTGLNGFGRTRVYARGEFWIPTFGGVLRTVDGTVWQNQLVAGSPLNDSPRLDSDSVFHGLAFTGTAFIGIASYNSSRAYFRSSDGVAWQGGDLPGRSPANYYDSIAAGGGLVVAVEVSGQIALSRDDGQSWTLVNSDAVTSTSLVYGGGRFVVLGSSRARTSTDGVNWSTHPFGGHDSYKGVVYYNSRYFAVRRIGATAPDQLIWSSDGASWSVQSLALPGYGAATLLGSPTVGPDGLYIGARGLHADGSVAILYSADGASWLVTQKTEALPAAYGGGVFLSEGGVYSAPAMPQARLKNLSVLGDVDGQPLIAGFVTSGFDGKKVLLRSNGPALSLFDVASPLPALSSRVFDRSGQELNGSSPAMLHLDSSETVAQATARVGAFPQTSGDRATFVRLLPGAYTLVTAAEAGATGKALTEIYDADAPELVTNGALANLSARAALGAGATRVIAGFVIAGSRPKTVLLRAVGQALQRFGAMRTASDPNLVLYNAGGVAVASSNDWNADAQAASIRIYAARVGAFALDEDSKDAAMLITLSPDSYSVHVSDRSGAGGEVLVEIYDVP